MARLLFNHLGQFVPPHQKGAPTSYLDSCAWSWWETQRPNSPLSYVIKVNYLSIKSVLSFYGICGYIEEQVVYFFTVPCKMWYSLTIAVLVMCYSCVIVKPVKHKCMLHIWSTEHPWAHLPPFLLLLSTWQWQMVTGGQKWWYRDPLGSTILSSRPKILSHLVTKLDGGRGVCIIIF